MAEDVDFNIKGALLIFLKYTYVKSLKQSCHWISFAFFKNLAGILNLGFILYFQ